MFYEAGKLYVHEWNSIIWQLDLKTGSEMNIIDDWSFGGWIHEGYMYYVEWEEKAGEILYSFKAMNLMTGEILMWDTISLEMHSVSDFLEVVDSQVIIKLEFESEDEMGREIYEKRYFVKEINEIMEMEWGQ